MKSTKTYQEAIEFLNKLPLGTSELDVIINYSKDNVDIHFKQDEGSAIPHFIHSKAIQYIEDIDKAIRKEHEVPLKAVDTRKSLSTQSYSLKTALELLKHSYDIKFNELEIHVHPKSVTVISRQNNEELQFIPENGVKLLLDSGIQRIEDALKVLQEKEKKDQRLFEETLKESPLPKVKDFFENLMSKLDNIDMSPIESIREKAEQLIKDQSYDKWDDTPFGRSVVEMKKLLESLDSITEDSYFEKIKSKLQSYNRQVIALNDSRKELDKLFSELPNKAKFSVNYDQAGFVDIVQVPLVSFIKRTGIRYANAEGTKIEGFVYEIQADGSYIELLQYDVNSINYFNDDIIVAEEKVPFERFTITKSGNRTFAVEVIDTPVF